MIEWKVMADTTTATVVFTDLVGSTALRAQLGEEGADRLRRDHDSALSDVVGSNGGEVVKGGGDGLLCLFDSASDALSAAVQMQKAIVDLGRRRRLDLRIRIGLSVGDVALEDGDCFGMPVVEAARLEQSAAPGQILCSEFVRAMARGRGEHVFEPVGALELKGLPEPTETYEVSWSLADRIAEARTRTPFVGRDVEMELLQRAWMEAAGGAGGTVLIRADAGMGKSRLVTEFIDTIDRGLVLSGTCQDGDTAPYAPISDALVTLAESDRSAATDLLGPEASVLATMAPMINSLLPGLAAPAPVAPELVEKRLLDSWERVLHRAGQEGPVVLVFDDLHWADQGTVAALRSAARVARRTRLLIVGAYRGAELVPGHPLAEAMAGLVRESEPIEMDLVGLDDAEVRDLLVQLGDGSSVGDRFVELIVAESGGNPLFIREALLHLVAEGKLRREGGRWVSDDVEGLELPEVLRHVIGRRLDRLSESTLGLLTVAALFDAGFPLEVTADVAEAEEAVALDALDEALSSQIIEPTEIFDTYRFTHAMFRHALVDRLSPSRRPRVHRRIAEALVEVQTGDPTAAEVAVIARHYVASVDLPGAEAGVSHALAHGDSATEAGSHRDALKAYESARLLLPPGDEREADIQRRIASAATLARAEPERILAEARLVAESAKDRADAAAFLVGLGRIRATEEILTAWRLGDIARTMHSGERDAEWVSLRSWELAERDWKDEAGVGFPLLDADRRELLEVAIRTKTDALGMSDFIWDSRDAALEATEWLSPLQSGLIHAFHLGMYIESIEPLSLSMDQALDVGDTGTALFTIAALGRVRFTLGHFDETDRLIALGDELVSRVDEFSNPALQHMGMVQITGGQRDPAIAKSMAATVTAVFDSLSPDLSWFQAMGSLARVPMLAANDRPEAAAEQLASLLDAVERTSPGTPNLPYMLFVAADVCDAYDIACDSRMPQLIEHLVLNPGFHYVESDGALALAIVEGLRGGVDPARALFQSARSRLDDNRNLVMRAFVPYYEARMEYRNGFPGGAERFDELIDEGRSLFGAMRGFEPRLETVEALGAARREGLPLPTTL